LISWSSPNTALAAPLANLAFFASRFLISADIFLFEAVLASSAAFAA